MKHILIATASVLAMTAAASAATPSGRYLWQGDVFITAATPQCSSEGKNVGTFFQAVFEPKGLPANDPQKDQLMIFPFGQLAALHYVPNTASGLLNGATSVAGTGINSGGLFTGTMSLKSVTVSPPTPKTNTPSVTITWTKTNASGCTFTASGNLAGPF